MQTLRQTNRDLVYVCDPVLGDNGKLYLPLEMVTLYKTELLQLASVITPNQFEAEQLTGREVKTEQEALQACHLLLDQGPQTVVRILPLADQVLEGLSSHVAPWSSLQTHCHHVCYQCRSRYCKKPLAFRFAAWLLWAALFAPRS